jgi:enoyl-CoA hydratase/carnithine racemase
MSGIHAERHDHVVLITMEGDNDLNIGLVGPQLHRRLEEYLADDELRCAVVTGAGSRAFSAGADLRRIGDGLGVGRPRANLWARRTLDLISGAEFWKPVIAAVNGHAIGAGAMLALACDIRIASENATFGIPEIEFGGPPGLGATQRLPRIIALGPAFEMLLSGDRISAEQACAWGLVNSVVPLPELLDTAMNLAHRIARHPPLAVKATKEAVMRGLDLSLEQGLRLEALFFAAARSTEDAAEAMQARAEKRSPTFKNR